MEYTRINKDKFLELLYEAYQAGCFGYMELKETQCEKIAAELHWETPSVPLTIAPSETTVTLPYSYDDTPGAIRMVTSSGHTLRMDDHLPPQQQTSFITQADFELMQQQMIQQDHFAMLIREQPENYPVIFTSGDTNVEVKSMQEQNPR